MENKNISNSKTLWYKKWCVWLIIISIFGILIAIPFIINAAYQLKGSYIVMWDAGYMLSFYGAILSLIGTIFLGGISIRQNNKLEKINKDLAKQNLNISMNELAMNADSLKSNAYSYSSVIMFTFYEDCIRLFLHKNDDFMRRIHIIEFELSATNCDSIVLEKMECMLGRQVVADYMDRIIIDRYIAMVDIKNLFQSSKQQFEKQDNVRLKLKIDIINCFNIVTTIEGEIMFTMSTTTDGISFCARDDFTSISKIEYAATTEK